MKQLLTAAALVLFLGGGLWAQGDIRQEIKNLGLSEAQTEEVVKLVRSTAVDLEKARAEARVVQAKLARLLLEDSPTRAEIEKLVKEGLDWDYKVKMARIDRSLKLRSLLGKETWARLSALALRVVDAEKGGRKVALPKAEDKGSRRELLELLRDIN